MPSIQTQAAFDVLTELYGEPSWLSEPKKGMDIEKVFAEWDEALKDYSEDQIKTVCRKMWKYAKTSTFPRLGHIMAMLSDVSPEKDGTPETVKNMFMDELAQYRSRCIQDGVNGHLCFSADVDEAMRRVMDEINAEYPPEHHWETRTASDSIDLAMRNGVFWDKLDTHLRYIVEMRESYSASGVVGELFDLPITFKSTEERKCA